MSKGSPFADLFRTFHYLAPQDNHTRMKIAELMGIQVHAKEKPLINDKPEEKNKEKIQIPINNDIKNEIPEAETSISTPQPIESIFTPLSTKSAEKPYWLASANKILRELPSSKKQPLPFSPLLKQEWTRAILARMVAISRKKPQPDIEQLISKMVKVEPILQIPNKEQLVPAPSIQLLIDKSVSMEVFNLDQAIITRRIHALFGKDRLKFLTFTDTPWLTEDPFAFESPSNEMSADNNKISLNEREKTIKLPPYSVVVALTDLGANETWPEAQKQHIEAWKSYINALIRIKCRLIILNPLPQTQWPEIKMASVKMLHWDRHTNLSSVIKTMQRGEK